MPDFSQSKPAYLSVQTSDMSGPIYDQQASAPTFEVVTRDQVKKPVEIVKTYTAEELTSILKNQFDKVNKETLDQFMDLLFNLKKDKNIDHKLRIQVFAKLFDCSERDAKKYYKAFKTIWKFQHLASELEAYLKKIIKSV